MASKRKTLCVAEKMSLIRTIKNGEKKSDAGRRFGISPSTVSTIWKNKENLLQANMDGKSSKKLKQPKFENLDLCYSDVVNSTKIICLSRDRL